jgi:hypothetical protein
VHSSYACHTCTAAMHAIRVRAAIYTQLFAHIT